MIFQRRECAQRLEEVSGLKLVVKQLQSNEWTVQYAD